LANSAPRKFERAADIAAGALVSEVVLGLRSPERKQIYLMNLDEVAGATEASKREMQKRVAERTTLELHHG
jgi:hypothetical protein